MNFIQRLLHNLAGCKLVVTAERFDGVSLICRCEICGKSGTFDGMDGFVPWPEEVRNG